MQGIRVETLLNIVSGHLESINSRFTRIVFVSVEPIIHVHARPSRLQVPGLKSRSCFAATSRDDVSTGRPHVTLSLQRGLAGRW